MKPYWRRRREQLAARRPRSFVADPDNDDRAREARREMRFFDSLPPEVRQAFAESRFGTRARELVETIRHAGACDAVKAALAERDLKPCDVGSDGVIIESIRIDDDDESRRLRRELAD